MANGYADALMLDYRGYVAEATGANVFFIKGDEIHTPMPDCFLNGITRQTVIGLAKAERLQGRSSGTSSRKNSANFDECFLTGTAAEITPVSLVGEYSFKPAQGLRDADQRVQRGGDAQEGRGRVAPAHPDDRNPALWRDLLFAISVLKMAPQRPVFPAKAGT